MTDQQEPAAAPESQPEPETADNDYDAPAAHAPEDDPQAHAGQAVVDPVLGGRA